MIYETDISLEKMQEVFELALKFIADDNGKVKLLEKKGDGDWMKAAEKYYDDLKYMIEKLYSEGVDKKTTISMLVTEFPNLSKSMVTNAYKKTVDLIKEGESIQTENKNIKDINDDIEEGLNYIFGNEKENGKMKPKNSKKEAEKVVEEVAKDLEKNIADSGIVVVSKKIEMEIKGQFGVYKVENNTVEIDGAEYKSKEDVETDYKEKLEYLEKTRDEALAVYKIIEKEIRC